MLCFFCKNKVLDTSHIGRRDTCSHCHGDLHICKNCGFYDISSYNECRESQADRVVEKERSNFCDYFNPINSTQNAEGNGKPQSPLIDAKKKLEELFRKK